MSRLSVSILIAAGLMLPEGADATTLEFNGGGAFLPDMGVFTSNIVVPDDMMIVDMTVTIEGLDHSFAGQLAVSLIKQDAGLDVRVLTTPGGQSNQANLDGDYSFNDNAPANMWQAAGGLGTNDVIPPGVYYPFGTNGSPQESSFLEVMLGQSSAGTWQLEFEDLAIGSFGANFDGWKLTLEVVSSAASVMYVDDDAPPGGDGLSWATAFDTTRPAEVLARFGSGVLEEIRVGQGTYKPSIRTEVGKGRSLTILLTDGLMIKGGYAGFGAVDPDLRDIAMFPSVFTGDILDNDVPAMAAGDEPSRVDNAHHVFSAIGVGPTTLLDGLAIVHGSATGSGNDESAGGGLRNFQSNPMVLDCLFEENWASRGGGIANTGGSSPVIMDCEFRDNQAENSGGAMLNEDASNPMVTSCHFEHNLVDGGGAGIQNRTDCSPVVTGCTFVNNEQVDDNGAGGAYRSETNCASTIIDCTFAGNSSDGFGGAAYFANSAPVFTGCSFSGNVARLHGGAALGSAADVMWIECSFTANTSTQRDGGAVSGSSDATVFIGCDFTGNTADDDGGGLFVDGDSPSIVRCLFSGNMACRGGGLALIDGDFVVVNTRVIDNSSESEGAGLLVEQGSATIINGLIAGNAAGGDGGGVKNGNGGSTSLLNTTVAHNLAAIGGAVSNATGVLITVRNTILWGNTPDQISAGGVEVVEYSDVQGGWAGTGNIDADPLFADGDGTDGDTGTAGDNNYRLAAMSPCIDAGSNGLVPADTFDLDDDGIVAERIPVDLAEGDRQVDDPDVVDTGNGDRPIVDMGAFEGAVCAGDTNGDGVLDVNDLNNVILDWGLDGSANGGDVTGPVPGSGPDGIVDVNDLNAVIVGWGDC